MKKRANVRAIAAKSIAKVLDKGLSLNRVLPETQRLLSDKDNALLQEFCFGILRNLPLLTDYLNQLVNKPLTGKQRIIHYLLFVGLYQFLYTRIPPHAIIAETVNAATVLSHPYLKGLVNGVLRQFQRRHVELGQRIAQLEYLHYLHPDWLLKRLQQSYPHHWPSIITANNQKPPMWLRVNRQYHHKVAYLELLDHANILTLTHNKDDDALLLQQPQAVSVLPGFAKGWVTVQDLSAQECVQHLQPENNHLILDVCAAPGGKTTHILEVAPKAHVVAVDIDKQRVNRILENLARLHQQAEIIIGDALQPAQWSNGRLFDKILLDAPCSATGVIRRHPDIKWLRRNEDIDNLVKLQYQILDSIWPLLKIGGELLYATCSVLPDENEQQISRFLAHHSDAELVKLAIDENQFCIAGLGKQILPTAEGGDGFYYAKIRKVI